jgi:cytochrome P450
MCVSRLSSVRLPGVEGATEQTVDYDPFSAEVLADPAPAHRRLRNECPVHHFSDGELDFYTLSRYEDVLDGLRDIDTWSSKYSQGPRYLVQGGMLDDPPGHTMFRRMVLRTFTPRAIERMEPSIHSLADELLDGMAADGATEGDLHDGFACPLPVITIARMLGVAEDDLWTFKGWSDAQVAMMGRGDPEAQQRARAAMNDYFLVEMARRRELLAAGEELPDDLVSGLVVAAMEAPRPIEDRELLGVLNQLLVGGNETTTSLITNAVVRLLEDRRRWEALVADPSLAEVAVEESLRYDPPVLGLFRTTTRDVERHGTVIPGNAKVMMLYASANRDPEVFEDPDEFRLDRDLGDLRRKHLAFGSGIHFCLGAPLARLEGRIALEKLATRFPDLELVGEPERIEPFLLFGKRKLPVRWR